MALKDRVRRLERIRFYQRESDNFEEIINGMAEQERTIAWGNGVSTLLTINDGELALTRV